MKIPLTSMEQLLPFATAGELVAKSRRSVVSVSTGATVLAAMQRMEQADIGFLVVLDGPKLAGVLSERDCARKVLLGQRVAEDVMVREIMTTSVITVTPEQKITACIALMHEKGIRHLPVMRGSEVTGVLSVRDLMGALIERHERLLRRLHEERLTLLYPDPSSY
jgi:CBS domain-containing protein